MSLPLHWVRRRHCGISMSQSQASVLQIWARVFIFLPTVLFLSCGTIASELRPQPLSFSPCAVPSPQPNLRCQGKLSAPFLLGPSLSHDLTR